MTSVEFTTESDLDLGVAFDADIPREDLMRSWHFEDYQRGWDLLKNKYGPLHILICGRGGTGKSSLVNNLFELQCGEDEATAGITGGAITSTVAPYERTTKFGDKIFVFDSPGFGDIRMDNNNIVATMIDVTKSRVDVLLYCISLSGGCRVEMEDIRAFKIITEAFKSIIWKRAVIVLTFANQLQKIRPEFQEYKKITQKICKNIVTSLIEVCIEKDVTENIPIEAAGYEEHTLLYENIDWRDRIFISALRRVLVEKLPLLFEIRYRFVDFKGVQRWTPKADKEFPTGLIAGRVIEETLLDIISPVASTYTALAEGELPAHKGNEFDKKMVLILIYKFKIWQEKDSRISAY